MYQGQGQSNVSNASTSGVIAPRIQPNPLLPDISNDFRFEETVRDGKTYKVGSGRLGVPGRVRTHRNQNAQRGVSEGSGDDAGHLIGNRFGARAARKTSRFRTGSRTAMARTKASRTRGPRRYITGPKLKSP